MVTCTNGKIKRLHWGKQEILVGGRLRERYSLKFSLSEEEKRREFHEGTSCFERKVLWRHELSKCQYSPKEDWLGIFFVLDPKVTNKTHRLQRGRQAGQRPGQTGSQRWLLYFREARVLGASALWIFHGPEWWQSWGDRKTKLKLSGCRG